MNNTSESTERWPRDPRCAMTGTEKSAWHKDPRTWELVQMLIKCRDALPAISVLRRDLHGVPPDLDKQIERLIEPWKVSEGGL
jgi:hypothetical protein